MKSKTRVRNQKRKYRYNKTRKNKAKKNNRGGDYGYNHKDAYLYCQRYNDGTLVNPKCKSMTQDIAYSPIQGLNYIGQSVGILSKPKPVKAYSYADDTPKTKKTFSDTYRKTPASGQILFNVDYK